LSALSAQREHTSPVEKPLGYAPDSINHAQLSMKAAADKIRLPVLEPLLITAQESVPVGLLVRVARAED
jgi:hypothetical protein